MPINKDALVRYRVINKCLINRFKKYPSKDELKTACMEALGVDYLSDRTIEKDLEDMRHNEELGYQAPIEYSKAEKGYYYTNPDYSIDKIPLGSNDINALQFAAAILTQFRQISMFNQFSGAVEKIVEALNINRMMLEKDSVDFIEFERAEYVPGGQFLEIVVSAIKDQKRVRFSYKKHGGSEVKEYVLEPYLLKQFRNIWYLIGADKSSAEIKTFGLDRFKEIEVLDETFLPSDTFNKEKYFSYAFGITSYHDKPEEVILSFKPKTGDFIKALPLHHTQVVLKDDKNECQIKITVYPTFELLMQILSYGPEVKVLRPASLQSNVKEVLKQTLERYK